MAKKAKRVAGDGIDMAWVTRELKAFNSVETPSWGYAQTGTRFGKFLHAAAATTFEQKVEDAAEVHRLTRITPRLAVHVLWDLLAPDGFDRSIVRLVEQHGLKIGAINPNVFQDQEYRFGSLGSPDPAARKRAIAHCLDSIKIGKLAGSDLLSLWFADGTNFPGQDSFVRRRRAMADGLAEIYRAMPRAMTMLVEYKPFEPAFYSTDIPDWGTAALLADRLGRQAKVLVDTGHHLPGTNIEQIVATLLDDGLLGGFHFNDRKYADDDLSAGSIAPYQLFLIFDQIVAAKVRGGAAGARKIAYMIDQSHNLKPKVEEMVQTVVTLQQLYAKALLVDRKKLAAAQANCDLVAAEETLRAAFFADVTGLLAEVREDMGAAADPLAALRKSKYVEKRGAERKADRGQGSSYA
jgi:L-rhamnose isomerase/sugar isomerase